MLLSANSFYFDFEFVGVVFRITAFIIAPISRSDFFDSGRIGQEESRVGNDNQKKDTNGTSYSEEYKIQLPSPLVLPFPKALCESSKR